MSTDSSFRGDPRAPVELVSVSQVIVNEEYRHLVPRPLDDEYRTLKNDIEESGILVPLIINDTGVLLDGYTRYQIAAEISLPSVPATRRHFADPLSEKEFVITVNLARRHLNNAQKADLGHALIAIEKERARERKIESGREVHRGSPKVTANSQEPTQPRGERQAVTKSARRVGIGETTLREWTRVKEAGANDPVAAKIRDEALAGERSVHSAFAEVVQKQARKVVPEPVATPKFPEGHFRCIVVDPPWPMDKSERTERPAQGKALAYPTMSIDDIRALPVGDFADPRGCQVYLWTTHRFLPDALSIIESWGAQYHCVLTWVKPVGMTPYSFMFNTELVVFAYFSPFYMERKGQKIAFEAPVGKHSEKPDGFFDIVEAASVGRRLEMFPRDKERPGWVRWGEPPGR